jgi:phospholipid-binding lipoprotein MlaA
MSTQPTAALRLSHRFLSMGGAVLAVSSLALLLAGPVSADEPTFSVVKQGRAIPISTPTKNSHETVYLSSAVPFEPAQKPTPKKAKAAVAKPVTPTDSTSRITVIKPAGHSKAARSSTQPPAEGTDDPWEKEYKNATRIADPIQPVNRGVFWFNHQLYHYGFSPLNKAYKFVFPHPVRTGIANAVNNIEYPVRFVNDLLQGKPGKAGLETEKFLLNSTAGVGGLIKVSNKFPALAELKPTDTSATFAKWGIPTGCYIVWPVIGPKSVRDTVGFAGDVALNPASWFTYGIIGGLTGTATLAVSAPQTVGNTSDKLDTYETVTKHSVDPYISVRSAYVQNRKKVESQ